MNCGASLWDIDLGEENMFLFKALFRQEKNRSMVTQDRVFPLSNPILSHPSP